MFRDGRRYNNGYWHQVYWNEKKDKVVSVPPIQRKIGSGYSSWMTPEQGKAIKQWVSEGGALWAFHNNSEASITNSDYREVEGAIYVGHPPIRPFKVKIVNREHPITRGVKDFVVTDEQHYVVYDKDPKYVLARSVNEDGLDYTDLAGRRSNTAEAVWAYDYGKGRVCFMAPGPHDQRAVESGIRKDAAQRREVAPARSLMRVRWAGCAVRRCRTWPCTVKPWMTASLGGRAGNSNLTRAAVRAHRAVLQSKGYAPSTINQRLHLPPAKESGTRKRPGGAAPNGWKMKW